MFTQSRQFFDRAVCTYPGITDNLARNEQSHRLNTFPRQLDATGYDTAFIGKWHMGNDDTPRPGFDTWAVMKGQGEAIDPEFNIDGERRQIRGYVTDILTDMATDKPALMRQIGNLSALGRNTVTPDQIIQDRQEMLMAVDEGIGKILEALEEIDALDDTIVVITSDHGYWYGEHALYAERRLAYGEGIRIPLLIRYPRKIEAGLRPAEIVLNIDVAPTLPEYAGAEVDSGIQGHSLIPVIRGEVKKLA